MQKYGWRVKKRKKYGGKIVDLLIRKEVIAFVVRCEDAEMTIPSHVTQAKKIVNHPF